MCTELKYLYIHHNPLLINLQQNVKILMKNLFRKLIELDNIRVGTSGHNPNSTNANNSSNNTNYYQRKVSSMSKKEQQENDQRRSHYHHFAQEQLLNKRQDHYREMSRNASISPSRRVHKQTEEIVLLSEDYVEEMTHRLHSYSKVSDTINTTQPSKEKEKKKTNSNRSNSNKPQKSLRKSLPNQINSSQDKTPVKSKLSQSQPVNMSDFLAFKTTNNYGNEKKSFVTENNKIKEPETVANESSSPQRFNSNSNIQRGNSSSYYAKASNEF